MQSKPYNQIINFVINIKNDENEKNIQNFWIGNSGHSPVP